MSRRYCLDLDSPAAGFIDSFLIGNGWLGATLRGGVGTERFDLNLDTVWSGGPLGPETGEMPARLIGELREAIRRRDYLRADALGRQLQGRAWTQSYQPLGAIELGYADSDASGYRRRLDLAEAVASTVYGAPADSPIRLDSFVSHPDGVLVALASGQGVRSMATAALTFRPAHPDTDVTVSEEHGTIWLVATARVPAHVLPNYVKGDDPVVYDTDPPAADGSVAAGMGYAVVAALQRDGDGLRLIASAASGFRGHDQRPSADFVALVLEARGRVARALDQGTQALRARHGEDYRGLFSRVDLDLAASGPAAERAELLFHFGRYLLISSSRAGTEAANLQGIWNVDVRPAWSSNYTININTQMNYWPAEAAGLSELAGPMFRLTRELAEAGAATAGRYYGAAGATAHHNADLWRFTAPVPGIPQWSNWPSGLYWMSAHLQHHLDHGNAEPSFAAETALPVFRAAAAFALDMLVEDDAGALVASPSTSPEHSFLVDGTPVAITQGTAMDQELIRETLENFVGLADATEPLAARARAALARLRLPVIGSAGNLLEWDDDKLPAELGHRHLSHLYGLYPGLRITEAGTPAAFEAVRRALAQRLDNGTGYTGWSQAWVLCLAARLRDHGLAERSIGGLLEQLTSRALLVLHPHDDRPEGYVFQIDGNFGAVAGLTELVVQSHEGAVSLLKTLPPSWPAGSISNIACRGGHQASVSWRDGVFASATITAGRDGELFVELPDVGVIVAGPAGPVTTRPAIGAVPGRRRVAWAATRSTRYSLTLG
ncbi:glycosyl hydrolase family 95 catalytic domain-containing protein [Devosia sp. A16]|uniref:glycosyl hydrolase family 95 catalytic domain-containing protein n=1 Tax=Devosia sp. A16 TaxID=1736675 RepID=UPI0006D7AA7D|nr:glycoside hydrolase N-terminal domain-containing protein [Devosia sp. A16]